MNVELQVQEISAVYLEPKKTDFYLLPETGFSVPLQIDTLPPLDNPEVLELWLAKTGEDIKAYWREYLKGLKLLPITVEIKNDRLIAPKYGNVPLVETTNLDERNGAVKFSVGKIEEFIVKAPPNSVALFTSPKGWSGRFDKDGNLTDPYPETQTYIYHKDAIGSVQGYTLISSLRLEENEGLLKSFSGLELNKNIETTARITAVTASPVFFTADNKYGFNPEGVVRSIHALFPKSFDLEKVLHLMENLDHLDQITSYEFVGSLIENFTESVRKTPRGDNFRKVVTSLLGLTLLEISRTTRLASEETPVTRTELAPIYYNHTNYQTPQRDYREDLRYMQEIGGCNGGGKKLGGDLVVSALGVRRTESGANGPTTFCATCKSEVKTYIREGIIYCALCGQPLGKIAKEEKKKK